MGGWCSNHKICESFKVPRYTVDGTVCTDVCVCIMAMKFLLTSILELRKDLPTNEVVGLHFQVWLETSDEAGTLQSVKQLAS